MKVTIKVERPKPSTGERACVTSIPKWNEGKESLEAFEKRAIAKLKTLIRNVYLNTMETEKPSDPGLN